jgi:DNA (cytosine-5)-methyltransferase 1
MEITRKPVGHLLPYKWYLKDDYPPSNGLNVFGTFICGGGSTMGYKLAGFNHLGGVEIDPKVAEVYQINHKPKYLYIEDIREFVKRNDLPEELYNLDILDGSPPCSSFSMAGNREKDWGKEKVFREGQAMQTLDDLFFDYIALAKKLQPKVVIAENVKGLIQGNAKSYVKKIKAGFEDAGYKVQLFLLNAASMGVPQKRERVFFICQRNDLRFERLVFDFNEETIPFGKVKEIGVKDEKYIPSKLSEKYWQQSMQGFSLSKVHPTGSWYNHCRLSDLDPCVTLMGDGKFKILHSTECRRLTVKEWQLIGSYPLDYNHGKVVGAEYLIGMSVPPIMAAQIANQIAIQWFGKTGIKQVRNGISE